MEYSMCTIIAGEPFLTITRERWSIYIYYLDKQDKLYFIESFCSSQNTQVSLLIIVVEASRISPQIPPYPSIPRNVASYIVF